MILPGNSLATSAVLRTTPRQTIFVVEYDRGAAPVTVIMTTITKDLQYPLSTFAKRLVLSTLAFFS